MLRFQCLAFVALALASGHAPLACEEDCATDQHELLQSLVVYEAPNVEQLPVEHLIPTPMLSVSVSVSVSLAKNTLPPSPIIPQSMLHAPQVRMHIWIVASVLLSGACLAMVAVAVNADLCWMAFINSCLHTTLYGSQLTFSYDIAVQHGGGATVSGIILAGPVVSNIFGNMLGQLVDSWHCMPHRSLMVIVTLLLGLNIVAFWGMIASSGTSVFMLVLARLVEGTLVGMRKSWRLQLLEDEEASESQVEAAMLWESIGAVFGLGMAPVMTSLGERLFTPFDFDRNSVMAAASGYFPLLMILPCCSVIWNLKVLRQLENDAEAPKVGNDANARLVLSGMGSSSTVFRVATCASALCLYTLVHSTMQAIEVGTSFLLEVAYGMDTKSIGLLVGISLLGIVPVAGILGTWLRALQSSTQLWVVNMLFMTNVLACLLFVPVNLPGAHWWLLILLGDTIIVGTGVTVSGVVQKHMLLACKGMLPWGRFNIILDLAFTLRATAGPLVRVLIANSPGHHQLVYALAQIGLGVCCAVLSFVFTSILRSMTT